MGGYISRQTRSKSSVVDHRHSHCDWRRQARQLNRAWLNSEPSRPVVGRLSTRVVLVVIGVLELLAVVLLSVEHDGRPQLLSDGLAQLHFLLYRLAIAMLHPGLPCPCIRRSPERLNLTTATANRLLVMAAIYVLIRSLIMVLRSFSTQQRLMRRILSIDPVRLDI